MGTLTLIWSDNASRQAKLSDSIQAMAPVRGVALQLGTNFFVPLLYLNNGVLPGGNYPVQVTATEAPPTAPVIKSRAVLFGVLQPCTFVGGNSGKYEEGCQEEANQLANSKGHRKPPKPS